MAQSYLNISMDADLKSQFEAFCGELGLSMSAGINALVKRAVRESRIPAEWEEDIPNEETRRSLENIRQGVNLSKGFSSVQALMEDLDADD